MLQDLYGIIQEIKVMVGKCLMSLCYKGIRNLFIHNEGYHIFTHDYSTLIYPISKQKIYEVIIQSYYHPQQLNLWTQIFKIKQLSRFNNWIIFLIILFTTFYLVMKALLQNNIYRGHLESKEFSMVLPQSPVQLSTDDSNRSRDFHNIQNYINENIKSKRRNILDIYSSNLLHYPKGQKSDSPVVKHLKPLKQKGNNKMVINMMNYERSLSKKHFKQKQQVQNDKDFIVSNIFSFKNKNVLSFTIENTNIPLLKPKNSSVNSSQLKHYKTKQQGIQKNQELPKISLKNKTKPSIKQFVQMCSQAHINPWQNISAIQQSHFNGAYQ